MRSVVYICGIHSIAFGVFHLFFWKIFNWKKELASASISTRAIIQIADLRLIYLFLGVGAICFVFPEDLIGARLGQALMIGMSLFWLGRLIEQFVFLNYNIMISHILNVTFVLGAVLFAIPVLF